MKLSTEADQHRVILPTEKATITISADGSVLDSILKMPLRFLVLLRTYGIYKFGQVGLTNQWNPFWGNMVLCQFG